MFYAVAASPCFCRHSFTASLNPWQRVMSACPWVHFTNSLISKAQGPLREDGEPPLGGAGAAATGAGAAVAAGAGADSEDDPPERQENLYKKCSWSTKSIV